MNRAPDPAGAAANARWQHTFAQTLRDASAASPAGLRAWNGSDLARRLAVHRNNVATSLTQALAETFPVVRELVGAEFFAAMARCHAAAHPPRSPVLVEYGDAFAPWLERFEPAADLPYLADVARLERSRVLATHAAEAVPLSAAALAERLGPALAAPQRLAASRLVLHPSLAVIRSGHAVVSLWAAHQIDRTGRTGRTGRTDRMDRRDRTGRMNRTDPTDRTNAATARPRRIEDIDLGQAESALVLRQGDGRGANDQGDFEVVVLPLPTAAAEMVQRLQDSQTLGQASAAAHDIDPGHDDGSTLALLIAQGAVIDWHLPAGD